MTKKNNPVRKLKVHRALGYDHYGVQISPRRVVHFAGDNLNKLNASVSKTSLKAFADGGEVLQEGAKLTGAAARAARKQAEARIGEKSYNLLSNNCEHFANEVTSGQKVSTQVKGAQNAAMGVAGEALAGTVLGAAQDILDGKLEAGQIAERAAKTAACEAAKAAGRRGLQKGIEKTATRVAAKYAAKDVGKNVAKAGGKALGRELGKQGAKNAAKDILRGNAAAAGAAFVVEGIYDGVRYIKGDIDGDELAKNMAGNAGGAVGGLGGASAGAAVGTFIFPGIGTVVGGFIGGLFGGIGGSATTRSFFD